MEFNLKKNIQYWLESSKKDFKVAQGLFRLKHYPQCLFFCHLSIEKILKAMVVKTIKGYPPHIHNLVRLAEIANLKIDEKQKRFLNRFFSFNIAGRYQEEKTQFYLRYKRREFAEKHLEIAKNLLSWLKKEFPKK